MIKFQNHREGEVFPKEPISVGLMFMDDGRFRGLYLKVIYPTIKYKDVIDPCDFKQINTQCKNHVLFRVSLILCKWKRMKLLKDSYWIPID